MANTMSERTRCPECGLDWDRPTPPSAFGECICPKCVGTVEGDDAEEWETRVEGPDEETWPQTLRRLEREAALRKLKP